MYIYYSQHMWVISVSTLSAIKVEVFAKKLNEKIIYDHSISLVINFKKVEFTHVDAHLDISSQGRVVT